MSYCIEMFNKRVRLAQKKLQQIGTTEFDGSCHFRALKVVKSCSQKGTSYSLIQDVRYEFSNNAQHYSRTDRRQYVM